MRLMLKKRFKDEEPGLDGPYGLEEERKPDDTDLKILESDYSSSTFQLASKSSVAGNNRLGQMRNGTGYGSRLSMNNSGMQTYTTGFYESHQGGFGDDQSSHSKNYFNI